MTEHMKMLLWWFSFWPAVFLAASATAAPANYDARDPRWGAGYDNRGAMTNFTPVMRAILADMKLSRKQLGYGGTGGFRSPAASITHATPSI
jgi:hypothetical protein